jgi:hypothetical protein
MPMRTQVRRLHIDTSHHSYYDTHEVLSDMISSGTLSSTEKITRFMNAIYIKKPQTVSLFSFNYRQHTERSTIKGICIGLNGRRGAPQKNAVVVSGLPFQDPSLIGVGLYVAAMISRTSPMMPRDVSVIPLAHPKEYEMRSLARAATKMFAPSQPVCDAADWIAHESVDLKDTCKPLETYITRKNKFLVNVDVSLTPYGTKMQYKDNTFPLITSKGKHSPPPSFTSHPSPPPISLPPHLMPDSSTPSIASFLPRDPHPIIANILEAPSFVLELKGTQALNDEQVVARGNEIIHMVRELLN